MKLYNAEVYHYSRNLDASSPALSNSSGSSDELKNFMENTPQFLKHWGLVIKILDEDKDEGFPANFIYHANSENGILKARVENFTGKFMKLPGATEELVIEKTTVSKGEADNFVDEFNERNLGYSSTGMNCQSFVEELIICLGIRDTFDFPLTAKEINRGIFDSISTSSRFAYNAFTWVNVKQILEQNLANGNTAKEILEKAMSSVLKQCSSLQSPGFQLMIKESGQQFLATCSAEVLENVLSAMKGAFSPWQFLQIPVEIITNWLIKKHFFKDSSEEDREAYAYALSKAASVGTAACMGWIAGPVGVAAATAFWWAAEIVSYIIRKCLEQTGNWFVKRFGGSKNERLVSIFIKCMSSRMKDYLKNFVAKNHLE